VPRSSRAVHRVRPRRFRPPQGHLGRLAFRRRKDLRLSHFLVTLARALRLHLLHDRVLLGLRFRLFVRAVILDRTFPPLAVRLGRAM
jgi:hypothetical protein